MTQYQFGRFLTLWRDKSPHRVNMRFGTYPRDEMVPWWPVNWIVVCGLVSFVLLCIIFSTGKYFLGRRVWFLRQD